MTAYFNLSEFSTSKFLTLMIVVKNRIGILSEELLILFWHVVGFIL